MSESVTVGDGFCHKLGLFVIQFAGCESVLLMFLSLLLGISKDECNAVTSGAKVDACSSFIKRVYEARRQEVPADVLRCLTQLGMITKLRNDILHRGVQPDGTVSSFLRALPDRVEIYSVSNETFDRATADLYQISITLGLHHAQIQGAAPELEKLRSFVGKPWQYKPPQPTNNRQKNQNSFQTQPSQPNASEE